MKTSSLLLLAAAALAVPLVSRAAIVNGDFSSTTLVNAAETASTEASVGVWTYGTLNSWNISGGTLNRNFATGPNSGNVVAQIFNESLTAGDYSLKFDYNWISTDIVGNLMVKVYLYDSLTGADLVYGDRIQLTNAGGTTPTDTAAWDKTLLASVDLAGDGTGNHLNTTLDFTLAADMGTMDRLAVMIYAVNLGGQTTATLAFDNVSVIPEPSTAVLMLISGLGVLALRRRKR